MACGKYAAELALAKTGDAQAMKRLFSLMLCRNTVLLVLYIVMFVLPIAAGEALDPNQVDMIIGLYSPCIIMLILDEVLYGLCTSQPNLCLLYTTTACTGLTALVLIVSKLLRYSIYSTMLGTGAVLYVGILVVLLTVLKKGFAIAILVTITGRVRRGDLVLQGGNVEAPSSVLVERSGVPMGLPVEQRR